jgi:hypothetical protein
MGEYASREVENGRKEGQPREPRTCHDPPLNKTIGFAREPGPSRKSGWMIREKWTGRKAQGFRGFAVEVHGLGRSAASTRSAIRKAPSPRVVLLPAVILRTLRGISDAGSGLGSRRGRRSQLYFKPLGGIRISLPVLTADAVGDMLIS